MSHHETIQDLKQVVQLIGDGIAVASSPAVIEIAFLLNSLGIYKKGFSGYVTNISAPRSITYSNQGDAGTVTIVK